MKKKIFFVFLSLTLLLLPIVSALALSVVPEECQTGDNPNCTICSFIKIFINGADIILWLSGAFAIIMFVFGGVVWITAYGSDARVKWGKDTLIATVIGILIVVLAWTLVNFILAATLGESSDYFPNWNSAKKCGTISSSSSEPFQYEPEPGS